MKYLLDHEQSGEGGNPRRTCGQSDRFQRCMVPARVFCRRRLLTGGVKEISQEGQPMIDDVWQRFAFSFDFHTHTTSLVATSLFHVFFSIAVSRYAPRQNERNLYIKGFLRVRIITSPTATLLPLAVRQVLCSRDQRSVEVHIQICLSSDPRPLVQQYRTRRRGKGLPVFASYSER